MRSVPPGFLVLPLGVAAAIAWMLTVGVAISDGVLPAVLILTGPLGLLLLLVGTRFGLPRWAELPRIRTAS